MFLSFVHWVFIMRKLALNLHYEREWQRTVKSAAILCGNWHFWVFKIFGLLLLYYQSGKRQLAVNFFTSLTSSKHSVSPTGNPLFNRNWTKGSISFQFGGSLSLFHMKHKKSVRCFIHLSKYGAHTIYLRIEFVTLFIKSLSRLPCYYKDESNENLTYVLSHNLWNTKGTRWLHFYM